MSRLEGKVAIVTGASSGLGAATARALCAEGASVVLADIAPGPAEQLAGELESPAHAVELDVREEDAWGRVVATAEERFGPVDVLVNNAGVSEGAPLERLSVDDFRRVVDINLTGVFLGVKSIIPSMRRAGGGSIVNISSAAGLIGLPYLAPYVASKWAVRGLTKSAAVELARDHIRVNSVHPGIIDTPLTAANKDVQEKLVRQMPLRRTGDVTEITPLIVYLASDESSYSTGSEFIADGGWHVP